MRRMIAFDCGDDRLFGTLDTAVGYTGLMLVSGGNEIRSGAHSGQASLAREMAASGHPVFRYDRRGIGESEGVNRGFSGSADDIAAAVAAFRAEMPNMKRLLAFGNCDAATALALFHGGLAIDTLVLANPWVIETAQDGEAATSPTAAAIRARYWTRLKNPRSLMDLFSGRIDLRKLAGGLAKAVQKEAPTGLAAQLAQVLAATGLSVHILIAERDSTALAFMAAYKDRMFDPVRDRSNINISTVQSASHSFADASARTWLADKIQTALNQT